ncbi:ATP-binding cassette domain-containing protein [Sphingomonas sp. GM_Shp_2]|uniref:ATP-binding cassette domain-containing protein n=1 Tax=Sphingomonas sp. GM_Shp_2 TaxID=2937380 RepID=UPI00226A135A|nr:ATP-binding cassette domain-containing protein [Sphingomonas sp. GM_Shp_2]
MTLADLLATERHAERRRLRQAALCAGLVAVASVLLLGLSGWFITAAGIAGATGLAAAQAFNYMLPSAGIRLLAIVRTGARYGERLAGHAAALGALARLRPALFRAIAASPPTDALALGRGEATARLIGDIDAVELRFVRRSGRWGVVAALAAGGALTALGGWAPMLATVACAIAALLAGAWLARRLVAPGVAVQRAAGALREHVTAIGSAAAELRCFALEDWAAARVTAAGDDLAAAQRAHAAATARFDLLHAASVATAAAMALLLSTPAGAPVAALAALAAAMTVDAIGPVLRALAERGRLGEAERRLEGLFGLAAPRTGQGSAADATLVLEGRRFRPGARVALTGASGAGKTTLLEGMLGLRPIAAGRAILGGRDLAASGPAFRVAFAWAPQDAALLAGTVRDNLHLAAPQADEAALWRALSDAALDDVVRALSQGLDTWLGEDGVRLSGGERRRLALARAYLADAPWLLLDEPGEGLDAASEALVAARLSARLARTGQGVVLVSHRPALLAICDRRLALDGTAAYLPIAA